MFVSMVAMRPKLIYDEPAGCAHNLNFCSGCALRGATSGMLEPSARGSCRPKRQPSSLPSAAGSGSKAELVAPIGDFRRLVDVHARAVFPGYPAISTSVARNMSHAKQKGLGVRRRLRRTIETFGFDPATGALTNSGVDRGRGGSADVFTLDEQRGSCYFAGERNGWRRRGQTLAARCRSGWTPPPASSPH